MVEFAQRSGAEHVYRALHVVHECIAACGFIKAQGESMTAVGRNFYGNGDGSETPDASDLIALRKVFLDSDSYIAVYDCNNDGKYDNLDLIRLKKVLAGFFG